MRFSIDFTAESRNHHESTTAYIEADCLDSAIKEGEKLATEWGQKLGARRVVFEVSAIDMHVGFVDFK